MRSRRASPPSKTSERTVRYTDTLLRHQRRLISAAGRDFLEQIFNVNDTISHLKDAHDADDIKFFVREALEYMAMTDYPYKSNFLKPLPAWPVNVSRMLPSETCDTFL